MLVSGRAPSARTLPDTILCDTRRAYASPRPAECARACLTYSSVSSCTVSASALASSSPRSPFFSCASTAFIASRRTFLARAHGHDAVCPLVVAHYSWQARCW